MTKEFVATNLYIELECRDGTKRRIHIKLPREEVEAGIYDYARTSIFNGDYIKEGGYLDEVKIHPLITQGILAK